MSNAEFNERQFEREKAEMIQVQLNPHVVDVRMLFDTHDIAVTLSIPMEFLEDGENERAALSLVSKLITMIPHLRDSVLEHKRLHETLRLR